MGGRPLEVAHTRRAALISCCMRLHNFCIDHRITEEGLPDMDGQRGRCVPGEPDVVPDRWEKKPFLDRQGRPVEHLNWAKPARATLIRSEKGRGNASAARFSKSAQRPPPFVMPLSLETFHFIQLPLV